MASLESAPGAELLRAPALTALFSLLLLGLVDNQILSPVLPEIARGFAVSVEWVGATVTGYALAAAGSALVIGPLSDRRGRKPFLLGAAAVFAVASGVAASADFFVLFALARGLAGAAAGVISALVVTVIADRVPYDRRGKAMGWVASAYFAAPILGVPAGAWLAEAQGWRSIYVVFALSAASLILALSAGLSETRAQKPAPDGALENGVAAGLSRYVGFLRSRQTAVGAWSAFFVSGGITVFIVYLGTYLQSRFGLSLKAVGLVFLLSGAASVVGALGAGPVSDRAGKRTIAVGGSAALAALLVLVPLAPGGPVLYGLLGLVGFSAASRVAPLQSLVTELVPGAARAAYVALRNTLSQVGIAFSASAGAALYARGGFAAVCYLACALSVGAAIMLLFIEEPGA
jgi:predicted MFS family arabinose efflux permease